MSSTSLVVVTRDEAGNITKFVDESGKTLPLANIIADIGSPKGTVLPGAPEVFRVNEGSVLSIEASVTGAGKYEQVDIKTGQTIGAVVSIGNKAKLTTAAKKGTVYYLVTTTVGSIDVSVEDAVLHMSALNFAYSAPSTADDTSALTSFVSSCGAQSIITFDPSVQYTLRGTISPLDGQELIGLNVKRCDQIIATTTAVVGLTATAIPVDDITGYRVGDSINIGNDVSSAVVTFDATNDLVLWPAHNRQNGDPVGFTFPAGVTMAGGLSYGTQYFVVNATADNFKVSATANGAAIDITAASSGGTVTAWAGCWPESFGCRPFMYSSYACTIASITPGVGNSGTLNLTLPLTSIRADGGSTSGMTYRAGSKVYTSGPMIGNRRNGVMLGSCRLTRPSIDGNKANQTFASWEFMAEIDLIGDNIQIDAPQIANFAGEGIVLSGENVRVSQPNIHDGWGNGVHFSARTASTGVTGALLEGGEIYNCNAAPPAWYIPDTRTLTVNSVNTSTEVLNVPSHGLLANTACTVNSTGTVPTGLTAATSTSASIPMGPYYYAIVVDADNIKLSATSGGAAIDITGTGTGTITITPWSLPTDKPNLTSQSRHGRYFGMRNIGHKAGAVCFSNNNWDTVVRGVRIDNCWTAIGSIDSGDNSRIDISGNFITRCGSSDDGSGTTTQIGAFNIGGKASIGSPLMLSYIGNRVRDCYTTLFGGTDATYRPMVKLDQNWFWNAPVTFKHIDVEHLSGTYDEPGGISAFTDILVWALQNVRGRLHGVTARGGNFGLVLQPTGTDALEVDVDGYLLLNQYSVGMQFKGSSAMPKSIIRGGTIKHDSTTNNMASGWTGVILANSGGYAIGAKFNGGLNVEFAYPGYASACGIRGEKATADVVANTEIFNARIHMASASQSPMSFGNAGGFLYKNVLIDGAKVYPDVTTATWDASVVVTNKLVIPA